MKVTKLILKIIIGFVILQMIYLLASEKLPKDISLGETREIGRMGDHAQGNYVLYTNRNTILSAPFVFGARLYLYDIEKDKSYLIKNQKLPFQEWDSERCVAGGQILAYGGAGMGGPPPDIRLLSLNGKEQELQLDVSAYGVLLSKSKVYYAERERDSAGKWHMNAGRMDIKTGEKEILLQRGEYAFESFYIYGNNLLAIDENENKLIVKNLSTGKESEDEFYEGLYPVQILEKTNQTVIIIGLDDKEVWKAVEYNLESKQGREITTLRTRRDDIYYLWDNSTYKDGYLYCNDVNDNLVRVDVNTGKKEIIVEASQMGGDMSDCIVSYCTDYIAIEAYYEHIRKLLIFDYEGKLVKKKYLL